MSWIKWLKRKWDLLAQEIFEDDEPGAWEMIETEAEKCREKPSVSANYRTKRRHKRQARRGRRGGNGDGTSGTYGDLDIGGDDA